MTTPPPAAEALLPCPFCNGAAEIVTGPIADRYGARCTSCDVWRDDRSKTKADAIAAWNTRAALTPPTHSADDAAVLDAYDAARDWVNAGHDSGGVFEDARKRFEASRAAVLARMAGKVPEGSVVLPKQAIEALYMRLWARHEHLDDGPPDFEPVRQPWTPDDDAALKAVAKYLFAAPEAPR